MERSQSICIITLIIYIVALIFFVCGFAGGVWVKEGDMKMGLWRACDDSDCETITLEDQPDWFIATGVLMIIALIGAVGSGVSFLWMIISAVFHCVTGLLVFLAIIIYSVRYDESDMGTDAMLAIDWELGWSFALATLSSILFMVNGGLLAFEAIMNDCDMARREMPCIGCPV